MDKTSLLLILAVVHFLLVLILIVRLMLKSEQINALHQQVKSLEMSRDDYQNRMSTAYTRESEANKIVTSLVKQHGIFVPDTDGKSKSLIYAYRNEKNEVCTVTLVRAAQPEVY